MAYGLKACSCHPLNSKEHFNVVFWILNFNMFKNMLKLRIQNTTAEDSKDIQMLEIHQNARKC